MKGKSILLLLVVTLSACGVEQVQPSPIPTETPTVFYVSPDGSNDWSGTLEKPNQGGTDGPFRTIGQAQETIRILLKTSHVEDFTVYIQDGVYPLDDPLEFTQKDSGQDGHRVMYRNAPGESPLISGGVQLTDWQPYNDYIYTTTVDFEFSILYENEQFSYPARHPNRNPEAISPGKHAYLKIAGLYEGHEHEGFYFNPETFPVLEDPSKLEMVTWNSGNYGEFHWRTFPGVVTEISHTENTILADLVGISERWVDVLGPGTEYFIQNSLELLDAPGEF
jgi:hypothetical protein